VRVETAVQAVSIYPAKDADSQDKHHVYITSSREFMEQFPNLATQVWFHLGMELQALYEGQSVVVHVEEPHGDEQPFVIDVALARSEEECTAMGAYALEMFRRDLEDWTMDVLAKLAGVGE
jgi:hypothetical protein